MSLPKKACLVLWTSKLRVGQCTRTIKTTPVYRGQKLDTFLAHYRYIFGEAKTESFTTETVNICHRRDRLPKEEWILIYNDLMNIRFRFLMSLLLPTVLCTFTLAIYEYRKNDGKFKNAHLEKLRRDCYEAGYFKYVIFFLMSCSSSVLIRNLQARVYRVYQSIRDPYKYYVFRSKSLIFSEWVLVPRDNIKVKDVLYDFTERFDTTNKFQRVFRRWAYGHATINGKTALIEEMFFSSNNYRTFMLKETNTIPPQIADLQKKLIEAKR